MDTQVQITAGPSEMQLTTSLMRPSRSQTPYGIDIDKATSVHFTTDFKDKEMSVKIPAFSATIIGMEREDGSGNSWNIHGYVLDYSEFHHFSGYYSTRTRRGFFTLKP